jgi:Uri superfamily endonuclease
MVEKERRSRNRFPRLPGSYALICQLEKAEVIRIGRLGIFSFEPGHYIYVGSALGPGGLAGRLERYLDKDRLVSHWHIDYLSDIAMVKQVWYYQNDRRYEHEWAAHLSRKENVQIPVPRFGASDCHCPAHLFYFEDPVSPAVFEQPVIVVDLK